MRSPALLLATLLLACSQERPPQYPSSTEAPAPAETAEPVPEDEAEEAPPAAPATCGGAPMRVTFYDVGQALSALVQLPDGRNILVDAGEQPGRAGCGQACRDWSQRLLDGLQRDLGQSRLDMLWITHQHSDHAGNVAEIMERFTVGAYVDNGSNLDSNVVQKARQAAQKKGVPVIEIGPEKRVLPFGNTFEVGLTPIVPEKWPVKCDSHPNDCSIGLRVDYCDSSVLFVGDAEAKLEAALDPGGPVTLLQVGHHGSNTSSSVAFIENVKPKYAVISSAKIGEGTNRTYCHPRSATVDTLTAALGGSGSRTIQSFDGATTCRNGSAANWAEAPANDNLWATARDGTVSLVTTGDGTFTRVQEGEAPVAEVQPSAEEAGSPAEGPSASSGGAPVCCRVCKAGKPCGDSCIAATSTCRKAPGCACSAETAGN